MSNDRPRIPRNVLIVAFVALASGFGQDLITPVLPAFLVLLQVSRADIGLIDGLLQGATNIFRFVSGVLSDRFRDRKRFIFFGYALSSVARPLLALTNGFVSVAVLRIDDGIGKGVKDAPRDALIADSTGDRVQGRAFGFHRLVDTAGSVLGPLAAAGLLFALSATLRTYRLIFALAAVPGAIALALIWFGVREPEPRTAVVKTAPTPLPTGFWVFTVATTVALLTKINDSLFLVRAGDIGIHRGWIPVLFAGFTLIYAALSYPIGIWSDRIGKLPLIAAGWLVLSVVEYGFAHLPSLPMALALFAGYGLFYALTEGSGRAFIATVVPPASRGSAYAVFYTVTGLAVIVGGYALGGLWDNISPTLAFHVAAGGSLVGSAILAMLMFKNRRAGNAAGLTADPS